MLSNKVRIAILNDNQSRSQPGAATIAELYFNYLKNHYECQFWSTSMCSSRKNNRRHDIKLMPSIIPKFLNKNRKIWALYYEFAQISPLFWIYFRCKDFKPDVIWIHQIGYHFPRTVIFIAKLLGIKIIYTFHDYSIVLNRKLYPSDFGIKKSEIDKEVINLLSNNIDSKIIRENLQLEIIDRVRLYFNLKLLNLCYANVAISSLQSKILKLFNIPISLVINNSVPINTSSLDAKNLAKDERELRILLAGRTIGKGFDSFLSRLKNTEDFFVHAAGDSALLELLSKFNKELKFEYHGMIPSHQLAKLIKSVDVVAVPSVCFDVFPTITLEALSLGVPVITTRTTGNFPIIEAAAPLLVISSDESQLIDLTYLRIAIQEFKDNISKIDLPNLKVTISNYTKLFNCN